MMGDQPIFLLVPLGLIALGIYFIVSKKGSRRKETLQVEATIVDFTTETDSSSVEGRGTVTTTSTFPVYEYEVDGKTYRVQGQVGITVFSKDKYRLGARETIFVNPTNPKKMRTTGSDNATATMGVMLIVFGLVSLFLMLFL